MSAMPLTVEAIYENGVLKLAQPLPLQAGALAHTCQRVFDFLQRDPHAGIVQGRAAMTEVLLDPVQEPQAGLTRVSYAVCNNLT
jgi:hypothetical protein